MAFSKNQAQVRNWGSYFGITLKDGEVTPSLSLDYWIAANRRAIDLGKRLLGDRFHVIRFETLCLSPANEIDRLVDFLGVTLFPVKIAAMAQIPMPPTTTERYRNFDIAQFSQTQIEVVRQFGFDIDPI